jgi:hypothetical protein
MASAVADPPVKITGMAKKKVSGEHKTPRVNVGFPAEWHAVARKIAAKRQQPVLYTMIAMLIEEAERLQIPDVPTPPWEDDSDE